MILTFAYIHKHSGGTGQKTFGLETFGLEIESQGYII